MNDSILADSARIRATVRACAARSGPSTTWNTLGKIQRRDGR